MLQYLLNMSAIWLLSLVIFDLFLRKEIFHNYNRIYLLSTFLLGVLLPLWTWTGSAAIYKTPLRAPIEQAAVVKENIVKTVTPIHTSFNWEYCLMFLYITGACLSLLFVLMEIYRLVATYKKGKKWQEGEWTIIETGEEHAPFSIFRSLYINKRDLYTDREWDVICRHEEKHTNSLHFIDLLIIQLARMAFWFHPLVYVYKKRLLLIHEYQADAVTGMKKEEYGQFLIEQSLLMPAPSLSHSFNRSPIKNRIIMLTHNTASHKQFAKLLVLPLLAIALVCCTKNMTMTSDKPVRNGNVATYKGNKIELSKASYDTIILTDPVNGNTMTNITMQGSKPVTLNGKPIYTLNDVDTKPGMASGYKNLREYILKNMKDELGKLNDGFYKLHVDNVVVDEHGEVAYYEYSGFTRGRTAEEMGIKHNEAPIAASGKALNITMQGGMKLTKTPNSEAELDKVIQNKLDEKIFQVMQTVLAFTPAAKDGKTVPCGIQTFNFMNYFKVQNHVVMDFNISESDFKPL